MPEYRLNIDAFSGEVGHVLESDRIVVTRAKSARAETIPLASIRTINLRQELPGVFSIFVKHPGGTLRITSRHFKSLGVFEDRGAEYAAFVRTLIAATAKESPSARFTAGSSVLYVLGWILVAILASFIVLLIIGAATRGLPPLRMLFVLPVGLVMAAGFIRQGAARAVDPANVPGELLPG